MLKLNGVRKLDKSGCSGIQIQHLLKLNRRSNPEPAMQKTYSNTTLVKVKFIRRASAGNLEAIQIQHLLKLNVPPIKAALSIKRIQIQHLLKLNASKINTFINNYSL